MESAASGGFAASILRITALYFFGYAKARFRVPPTEAPRWQSACLDCKPEPAKPWDRESRRKKTSSTAAVPPGSLLKYLDYPRTGVFYR
jgi:hypothetical protein